MAIDIDLHRKTLPEHLTGIVEPEEVRDEILNRERTWYVADVFPTDVMR